MLRPGLRLLAAAQGVLIDRAVPFSMAGQAA